MLSPVLEKVGCGKRTGGIESYEQIMKAIPHDLLQRLPIAQPSPSTSLQGTAPAPPQPHAGTAGPVEAQPHTDRPGTLVSAALMPGMTLSARALWLAAMNSGM